MPLTNCTDYACSDELGEYQENVCNKEFVGDFSAGVLFNCDSEIDDTSIEDGTAVQAEIDASRAKLITGALFTIEDPAPQEAESQVPCRPKSVTGIQRTGNYNNPNVNSGNDDFHDVLFSGKKFGGLLLYECTSNKNGNAQSKWINSAISFTGGLSAKPKTIQAYAGKFNWDSMKNPKTVATPAGIFD